MSRTVLFPHMPKTAGSSLREALLGDESLNTRLCYASPLKAQNTVRKKFRNTIVCTSHAVQGGVVYGHFGLGSVPRKLSDGCTKIMFFREPVDWLGSYLYYVEAKFGIEVKNLEGFVYEQNIQNAYQVFLGRYSVDDLDLVCLFEDLESSVVRINKMLSANLKLGKKNVTSRPMRSYSELLEGRFGVEAVESATLLNLEIYKEAKRKFDTSSCGS